MCGSHQDSSSDLYPCKTQSARSVFPLRSESPALLLVSVFSFSFFRASANDKLRARSFSSSFAFSLKLSAASFLRLSLLTQEPRLELLPIEVIIIDHPIFSFALSLATSTCSTAPNRADLPWNSQSESKNATYDLPVYLLCIPICSGASLGSADNIHRNQFHHRHRYLMGHNRRFRSRWPARY